MNHKKIVALACAGFSGISISEATSSNNAWYILGAFLLILVGIGLVELDE